MRIKILLLLLVISKLTYAQKDSIPLYVINADTLVFKMDDAYWQMLVDTSGKLTIDDVRKPQVAAKFHANNTKTTGLGFSKQKHYWQRFRLKNNLGKETTLVFGNRTTRSDKFDIYTIRSNGKMEKQTTGYYVPLNKRDGFKTRVAVTVKLAADEEIIVYKKIFLDKLGPRRELALGLGFYEQFVQDSYINEPQFEGDVRNWFIAGILIFGFFINFFFYYIVREKVYLYLALLLLFEGFWYTTLNSNILFRNTPDTRDYIQFLFTHLSFFFCVSQFVRYFLKTKLYYPRWNKALIGLTLLMLLTDTINFIIGSNAESYQLRGLIPFVSSTSFAAMMFALFFSFIFFKKENDKLTNLSVVAALPAFFLWSFVYYITRIFEILNYRYDQNPPAFMSWMYEKQPLMEMFFVGWFAILFTWILMQRYALLRKQLTMQALEREKEKTELINRQKEELEKQVEERTSELKDSIEELKTTQKQLIHSEKMASLGELTAGIAHEIQNPLNFVNNFSEVNTELIDEMQNLVKEGNTGEALELAADLKANLEKINFHGKRADSIVKNMLQHSRKSTGNKEPADLNALTDEYLRLSYHGLRAKDKSFNATIETHYDPSVGKVDMISQDFGRVLLNLFNNAFYSVAKKKQEASKEYQPTVMVTTQRNNNHVEIKIRDNGLGIPKSLLDKIYQPFFTTKPTGEGTGLGLSLSYDIVTKAHGGQIKFDTKEGEFAEFRIALPVENNK